MKVNDFRISRFYVQGVPRQLVQDCGRLGRVVRRSDYATLFNRLLNADNDELLKIPWPRERGPFPTHNKYWHAYVIRDIKNRPQSDPGALAWEAVVPFARKAAFVGINRSARTFVESWYYPHGVAMAVTAWFIGAFDPETMRTAANEFLRDPLDAQWSGGGGATRTIPPTLNLEQLAEAVLEALRSEAFGADGTGVKAFTILTICQASADKSESESEADPFIKAALALVDADPSGNVPADRAIYAVPRGRVVWRRDRALLRDSRVHTLSCLHRNVGMATLQAASLLQAAEMLSAAFDEGHGALPARVEPYARKVAGLIGRIFGLRDTYAAPFLRTQISEVKAHARLDELRTQLGMELLK